MSNQKPLRPDNPSDIVMSTPIVFTSERLDLAPSRPRPRPRSTWSLYEIHMRLQTILADGPSAPSEWWIHELAKHAAQDADALCFTFHVPTLQLGFSMLMDVFPPGSLNFRADVEHLLPLLPIREGEDVQRVLLIEVILYAARELRMDWWDHARSRMALVFGVMHACMIQRKREEFRTDDGVSRGLGKMELGRDESALLDRLADDLADVLRVKI
ncbi:uncharacterized protein K460DRAFT_352636 [Cucurbitaria berberidis CBS 394.84]|uniref:Uncharacterized protein n=1 Tax=Cucurbitaria berberidis CBS 394.84 TaxID=1168544 RepID=A0A9P4L9Q9_9PLEO|nr:uncharacterized protein K460DRAFT_352636 [Cucurbitaria berberidis CBS 394.84]KAF1847506.1 hypothetical protein K460DRAFT_352636 [Cucurbitaria berberidis CBS 394.84]